VTETESGTRSSAARMIDSVSSRAFSWISASAEAPGVA
jgi:hypothetical protein